MKGLVLAELGHVVNALAPVDVGGAAKTSDYFSLKNYAHATIIVVTGVVGNDTLITVEESDDNVGSSTTAIAFARYEEKTAAGDTLSVRTATTSAGFQTGTANGNIFVIEIDASELTDGYPYLVVKTDNAAASLVAVVAILSGSRYAQEQTPTAIT
jgi:hypothetical protein